MERDFEFAKVSRRFQALLRERYFQPVAGEQFGAGGGFLSAPHVTTGQYGVGPIGLIGQRDDRSHPDWWQLVVRHPMQPSVNDGPGADASDPDMDMWTVRGAEWVFEGNAQAALRDLTLIVLGDFAFRDFSTSEGDWMERGLPAPA